MFGTRQTADTRLRSLRPNWRQLGVAAGVLLSAVLVFFHALLLWSRISDLSIFQPLVAIEWLAGCLLLLALRHLQRNHVPLLHGRKALAFWLLVLLVHLIAAPPGAEWLAEPGGLLLALPATWLLAGWITVAVALWAMAHNLTAPLVINRRRGSPPQRTARRSGHPVQLFARPPPFLQAT